ncbi:MAG: NAD(P)/FAD-dependent oxidoreductase [Oscillospiraceae bacterium]|nr:NAD(P)/FAD-dependent oxidoreductase [Oscillospiraceae bacterium]
MDTAKLQKKLDAHGLGRFRVRADGAGIVLEGDSGDWNEIVAAGLLCAKKHSRTHVINDIRFTGAEIPPMRAPSCRDASLDGARPDVLVIGGGIVGCAAARELTKWDLSVLLIEKESDVALGASGRNDGCVHPGIDLVPGSLKQKYNLAGNRMFDRLSKELGFEFRRQGQVLAFPKAALYPLLFLTKPYFAAMGLGRVRVLGRRQLHALEPKAAPGLRCGLFFPTGGIICPYNFTIAYAENAAHNGARISLETAALSMRVEDGIITAVETNRGTVYPRAVVNAAGVFSEDIARMAGDRFFSIHPRKGTNVILDKKAKRIVRTSYSQVGSVDKASHSKGGGIVSTVDGNVLVGPDAFETYLKEDFTTDAENVRRIFEKHAHTSPELSRADAITYFSGVRAATYEEDFIVEPGRRTANIFHAAGIQSPGLTAAPAIALALERMCVDYLKKSGEVRRRAGFDPVRRPIPRAAQLPDGERAALIRSDPDYGEIVCRCEQISKGEILAALRRELPCRTVDGVKKRVRPGMGRCQGGFCSPLVTKLIAEECGIPLDAVKKGGGDSYVLEGMNREAEHD